MAMSASTAAAPWRLASKSSHNSWVRRVGVQVDRGRAGRQPVGAFGGIAELLGLGVPHPHPAAPGRSHQPRQALPNQLGRAARRWVAHGAAIRNGRGHALAGEKCCGLRN